MQLECKTTTVLDVKGLGPAQALAALKLALRVLGPVVARHAMHVHVSYSLV